MAVLFYRTSKKFWCCFVCLYYRTIRPDSVVRSIYKATGCSDNPNHHVIYLEHVVVRITITHPRRGDLAIYLTSPSGTRSQLLANRYSMTTQLHSPVSMQSLRWDCSINKEQSNRYGMLAGRQRLIIFSEGNRVKGKWTQRWQFLSLSVGWLWRTSSSKQRLVNFNSIFWLTNFLTAGKCEENSKRLSVTEGSWMKVTFYILLALIFHFSSFSAINKNNTE